MKTLFIDFHCFVLVLVFFAVFCEESGGTNRLASSSQARRSKISFKGSSKSPAKKNFQK